MVRRREKVMKQKIRRLLKIVWRVFLPTGKYRSLGFQIKNIIREKIRLKAKVLYCTPVLEAGEK